MEAPVLDQSGGAPKTERNNRMFMKTLEVSINKGEPTGMQSRVMQKMFGCHVCPHRALQACVDTQNMARESDNPFVEMIQKGKTHANHICQGRVMEIVARHKLLGKPSGMRVVRNSNIFRLQEYTDHLYERLHGIKQETGALTKEEKDLMWAFHQTNMELNKRLESALKQDEGTKVEIAKLTPSQVNELMRDGVRRKELIDQRDQSVSASVISDSISKQIYYNEDGDNDEEGSV